MTPLQIFECFGDGFIHGGSVIWPLFTINEGMDLLYIMSQEPGMLQKAEERQARILDADYSKIEMDEYIQTLDHLDSSQKELLLSTLKQFSQLFGGGLG